MKRRYKIAGGILAVLALAVIGLALALSHDADCEPAPDSGVRGETMRAYVYHCYGSPDVLELASIEKPAPAEHQVLVKVLAASVNPLDWHYLRGSPYIMRLDAGLGKPKDPRIGVDFAGTVEAIGANVTAFRPGDAVFGGRGGAFADYLAVSERGALVAKPDNISFEQAAAVPIAGITVLQALRDKGKIRAGQKVLINGASGGVGTFAVQIAKSYGAEVTGVCSTRNVELVKSIGADHVIDYTRENYTERGVRYDLIVDMVGNHSLSANRKALTPDGTFVIVGGPAGDWLGPLISPIKAFLLSPFVDQEFGMLLSQFNQADLAHLGELMRSGQVTPVIDRQYSLAELPEAIRYSESGRARGKIIIEVDPARE